MAMEEASWIEDWGQKVDLTARLREILVNYPEGTSILKELLQNADDARATAVAFCLDHRSHPSGKLLAQSLAAFQGPALLAYNDGVFSPADFESISRIGDSVKRHQAGKTGRFGLGFNACYHLCDLPSFVSGEHLALFDPHCKFLPAVNATNPGKKLRFTGLPPGERERLADQVAPFCAFGCDMAAPFQGTLFRFPLRTPEQAEASRISKQAYSADAVAALLSDLSKEAPLMLLFLKSVQRLQVHEWVEGAAEPTLLYECRVADPTPQLCAERALFMSASELCARQRRRADAAAPQPPVPDAAEGPADTSEGGEMGSTFELQLECRQHALPSRAAAPSAAPPAAATRRFLLSQRLGGAALQAQAASLAAAFQVAMVPWGAVAAELTGGDGGSGSGGHGVETGRGFCFLPLPGGNGLPCHVNGFFEISSNRRDLWYGEDMAGVGARRSQWNVALLQQVCAPAYAALMAEAARRLGPGRAYNRLWPPADAPLPWRFLATAFYAAAAQLPLVWTPAAHGGWLAPGGVTWPDDAVQRDTALRDGLVALGVQLPDLAADVQLALLQHAGIVPRRASPAAARDAARAAGAASAQKLALPQQVPPLLAYCLSDLQLSGSAQPGAVQAAAAALRGLHLLPCKDGSLAALLAPPGAHRAPSPGWRPVFALRDAGERSLLSDLGDLALDQELLGSSLTAQLMRLAAAGATNLALLTPQALLERVLPRVMPPLRGSGVVVLPPREEGEGGAAGGAVSWKWLQALWTWLSQQPNVGSLHLFAGAPWPLLPLEGGLLAPLPASRAVSTLLAPGADWPPGLVGVLRALGCGVVDMAQFPLPLDALVALTVHPSDGVGVAAAVAAALRTEASHPLRGAPADADSPRRGDAGSGSVGGVVGAFGGFGAHLLGGLGARGSPGGTATLALDPTAAQRLSGKQRQLLRSFLLQGRWYTASAGARRSSSGGGGGREGVALLVAVAQRLPLFEAAADAVAAASEAAGATPGGDAPTDASDGPSVSPSQQAGPATTTVSRFTAIEPGVSMLAPQGVLPAVLPPSFVAAPAPAEAEVMVAHLGVLAPSAASVYLHTVLPRLGQLPTGVRDAAMMEALRQLPQLAMQEPVLVTAMRQARFVPDSRGELHTPGELYDPRNTDLLSLLDPDSHFPSAAYCAAESALPMLQRVGLRASAGPDTLLSAARFTAALWKAGQEGGVGYQLDEAAARGKALLSFLELEAERLVPWPPATLPPAAAVVQSSPQAPNVASPARLLSRVQGLLSAALQAGGGGSGGGVDDGARGAGGIDAAAEQQAAAQQVQEMWGEMKRLAWCPVLVEPPIQGLPWSDAAGRRTAGSGGDGGGGGLRVRLSPPCVARPLADAWLCSASLAVVDGDCRSPVLAAGLGWAARIPSSILAAQLRQLGAMYPAQATKQPPAPQGKDALPSLPDVAGAATASASGEGETGHGPGAGGGSAPPAPAAGMDAAMGRTLAGVVAALYTELSALSGSELQAAAAVLGDGPSIWVGNGFAPPARVAFTGALDLSPHLWVLPAELAPFRELLAALGVRPAFAPSQYRAVLADMAAAAGGQPLRGAALSRVLTLVQCLANSLASEGAVDGSGAARPAAAAAGDNGGELLLPDSAGVLRPVVELAYNDAPWLEGEGSGLTVRFTHPDISAAAAERLGAASLRRLLLAQSAAGLALSLAPGSALGGVEAFGQSEALTTRLRHIIQDYPEGVLGLELVQNADDAGARSVAFCLDLTTYGTASTLGARMAAWQGPALLSWNDATFSPSDFAAIARIGQDSKMARPASIGRFGLGFNSVYHVTDVPSFASGDHLVLFDPHAAYLPGASPAQPGLKLTFRGSPLVGSFPDAFAPYLHFGCSLKERYDGTLFRFPLRDASAAASSDVKSTPTTPAEVLGLFRALRAALPSALLFLKNVKRVDVWVRTSDGQASTAMPLGVASAAAKGADGVPAPSGPGAVLLFRAEAALEDEGSAAGLSSAQSPILQFIAGTGAAGPSPLPSSGPQAGPASLDAFYARLASAAPSQLPASCASVRLMLSEVPAAAPVLEGNLEVLGAHAAGEGNAASGGVGALPAALALTRAVDETWVVVNQLAGGAARKVALAAWKARGVKMVPWVGVAARVLPPPATEVDDSSATAPQGRAFCFLPLPVATGLPVHVNGFFELSSNRRELWHGGELAGSGRARAEWNAALLEDGVAPAYLALLVQLAGRMGPVRRFFGLLPTQGVSAPFQPVVAALYQNLLHDQPLLWTPALSNTPPAGAVGTTAAAAAGTAHRAPHGGRWLSPSQALLPDAACLLPPAWAPGARHLLARQLLAAGTPLAAALAAGAPGGDDGAGRAAAQRRGWVLPGVPDDVAAAMLQLTPGVARVTPRWVRRHLAASPAGAAAIWAPRMLPPSEAAAGDAQEDVAPHLALSALLDYCLSDMDLAGKLSGPLTDAQAQLLRQLHRLPLLPMADGSTQCLTWAPRGGGGAAGGASAAAEVAFVAASPSEAALLACAPHLSLHPDLPQSLHAQLLVLADSGFGNVVRLTPTTLVETLLPAVLPAEWRGCTDVAWAPPGGGADVGPSSAVQPPPADLDAATDAAGGVAPAEEADVAAGAGEGRLGEAAASGPQGVTIDSSGRFVALLWHWLGPALAAAGASSGGAGDPASATGAAGELARACEWPLLPVVGSRLHRLEVPAKALRPGDWPDQLTDALVALGARMTDASVWGESVAAPPALAMFVQPPTAAGVLDALAAAHGAPPADAFTPQRRPVGLPSAATGSAQAALAAASGGAQWRTALAAVPAAGRRQLRAFLLQPKWCDARLGPERLALLRTLPIFEVHADELPPPDSEPRPTSARDGFTALDPEGVEGGAARRGGGGGGHAPPPSLRGALCLAPPWVPAPQLLGGCFLRSESSEEAAILHGALRVPLLDARALLEQCVAPRAAQLQQRGALAPLMAAALTRLGELMAADAQLAVTLSRLPLIPTRGGGLAAARQLADPSHLDLAAIMDPAQHFPAPPFDKAPLLQHLHTLGMAATPTLGACLHAARTLEAHSAPSHPLGGEASAAAATGQAEARAAAVGRAKALVRVLGPLAEAELAQQEAEGAGEGKAEEAEEELATRQALWGALADVCWCPVLQRPPEPALPWPHCTSAPLLAAPRMVRPARDAWVASAACRLLAADVSPALEERLGWSGAVRAPVAVAQLMELGTAYPAGTVTDPRLVSTLDAAAHALYRTLAIALEDGQQADAVAGALAAAPAVWTGCGFVEGQRCALSAPTAPAASDGAGAGGSDDDEPVNEAASAGDGARRSGSDPFQPVLWVVPPSFAERHGAVLSAAGVSDAFGVQAFVAGLRQLAALAGNGPLRADELALALRLAEAAAATLQAARAAGAAVNLREVWLPDEEGVMATALQLHYNDAPWLLASLGQEQGGEGGAPAGVRLVHSSLGLAAAEALGCRSVRHLHEVSSQVTSDLPCPSAALVRSALTAQGLSCPASRGPETTSRSGSAARPAAPFVSTPSSPSPEAAQPADGGAGGGGDGAPASSRGVLTALLALLEVADAAGCPELTVTLDCRSHGTQSLLAAGLADTQGPALCATLADVVLTPHELSALLAPTAAEADAGGPPSAWGARSVRGNPLSAGVSLVPAFAVTDVPQALSGGMAALYDPGGAHLGTGAAASAAGCLPSRARAYAYLAEMEEGSSRQGAAGGIGAAGGVGSAPSLLLHRFKDQFEPWGFSGQDIYQAMSATLLRWPLRSAAGAASPHALAPHAWDASGAEVGQQLAAFCRAAGPCLLALGRLQRVRVSVIGHEACRGGDGGGGGGGGSTTLWQCVVGVEGSVPRPGVAIAAASAARAAAAAAAASNGSGGAGGNPFGFLVKAAKSLAAGAAGNSGAAGAAATTTITQLTLAVSSNDPALEAVSKGSTSAPEAQTPTAGIAAASASVAGGGLGTDISFGSERWVVCTSIGGGGSRHGGGGGGTKAGRDVQGAPAAAAVALRLGSIAGAGVLRHSGLLALAPLPAADHAASLGRQGFVVVGNLSLTPSPRGWLPAPTLPVLRAAAAASAAAAAASTPEGPRPPPPAAPDAGALAAAEHNRGVLHCLSAAWVHLLTHMTSRTAGGPPEGLYEALMPDLVAAQACGDEDAAYAFKQMYHSARQLSVWCLTSPPGSCGMLAEAAFLQPMHDTPSSGGSSSTSSGTSSAPSDMGPAARAFVQRHMRLFRVPYGVKLQLEAAGVSGLRTASPSVLRPLLRSHARRNAADGRPPYAGMMAEEAGELLAFCVSDLQLMPVPAHPDGGAPPPAAAVGGDGGGLAGGDNGGRGGADVMGQLTAGMEGLRMLLAAGVQVAPALAGAASAADDLLGGLLGSPARGAAGAPPPHFLPLDPARVDECRGLPIPTAAGTIAALGPPPRGAPPLLVYPMAAPHDPPGLFPASDRQRFVAPSCLALLSGPLRHPQLRSVLGLQYLDVPHLALLLRGALEGEVGPQTAPRHASSQTAGRPQEEEAAAVAWDDGAAGGPLPAWLRQFWELATFLAAAAPEWGAATLDATAPDGRAAARQPAAGGGAAGGAAGPLPWETTAALTAAASAAQWDALGSWPLIPLADGRLLRVCRRGMCLAADPFIGGGEAAGGAAPAATATAAAEAAEAAEQLRDGWPALLPEPWSWLLPPLAALGVPMLDGRFAALLSPLCGPPHLDIGSGAPPLWLGPSVAKAAEAWKAGLLREELGDEFLESFFALLSTHPPRDLDATGIAFLRSLPMVPLLTGPPALSPGGPSAAPARSKAALDLRNDWVFVSPEAATVLGVGSPEDLVALLPQEHQQRLLQWPPGSGELLAILGCEPTTVSGVVAACVLPALLPLSGAADGGPSATAAPPPWGLHQDQLVRFIQRQWPRLRADSEVIHHLKLAAWVAASAAGAHGGGGAAARRAAPTELYDPGVALFGTVLGALAAPGTAPLAFPAGDFASQAWLQVLRDCGLRSKVSPSIFLSLARHVDAAAHGAGLVAPNIDGSAAPAASVGVPPAPAPAPAVLAAGEALLQHLLRHVHALASAALAEAAPGDEVAAGRAFWSALAGVAFVPAVLGIPGSASATPAIASYAGAALQPDWRLVWSVLPLVPEAKQLPSSIAGQLRIRSPPPFAAVLAHLRKVGADHGAALLAAWPHGVGPPEEVFGSILRHLEDEGLSEAQLRQLRDVPLVPVANGSRLARAAQLYARLPQRLDPFAYEVPPALAARLPLLVQLGARQEPRARDLVEALSAFAVEAPSARLNPNEAGSVIRLLEFLCTRQAPGDLAFLQGAKEKLPGSQDAAATQLLALAASGELVPASRLVSVGPGAGRLLGRTDPSRLLLAHPRLPEHVCRWLGVPGLAEAVMEQLDPLHPLAAAQELRGTQLADTRALLTSPAFAGAAYAVVACFAAQVPALRPVAAASAAALAAQLRGVAARLVFVERLATRVVMRASGDDVTRDGAAAWVYDFLCPATGTLYVAAPPPGVSLPALLSAALSRALGSPLTLPLQALFEAGQPELLAASVPTLLQGGWDPGLEAAAAAGVPGSPLLPRDEALLTLAPLRSYEAGEVVAVRRGRDAAAAAALAAERRAGLAPGAGGGGGGGETGVDGVGAVLAYARVAAAAAPPPEGGVYRLLLETTPGRFEQLLSSQVFSFRSAATAAGLALDAGAAAPSAGAAASTASTSARQTHAQGSSEAAVTDDSGADAPQQPLQQVQAAELVGAVRDILAAAQLPLDLSAEKLMQQCLEAQQELQQTRAALSAASAAAAAAQREREAHSTAWQCRVCFGRDVDACFLGCGHVFCSTCVGRLPACPVCRKRSEVRRLYK